MTHLLNCKRDKIDYRDVHYRLFCAAPKPIPRFVDLRPLCSPIDNQYDIGSCTGNASAGAFEFLELQCLREKRVDIEVFDPTVFSHVSRLFIYYSEREIEGTINEDSGAQMRTAIKAMADRGVCREELWKYDRSHLFQKPSEEAYNEANNHRIVSYYRLNNLNEIRHCLADGYPIIFGMMIFTSMESEHVAATGLVPDPTEQDICIGGHAVLIVGYDDDKKRILVRNSWGTEWGQQGYFWLSYDYVSNPELCYDFWTIRR